MWKWTYKTSLSVALFLLMCAAPAAAADQDSYSDLAAMSGLRKYGLDFTFWGWAAYSNTSQSEYYNYFSGELELDITKSFGKVASLAADMEFWNDGETHQCGFEQLFGSVLLSQDKGVILTVGKFNSPIGLEGHDFWDRYTATPSLLFFSQPQDLRGVMLTLPVGTTDFKLRSYVVSGFADEDHIPDWPSFGTTIEYQPNEKFNAAVTGWVGPGVTLAQPGPYGYHWGGDAESREYAAQLENFWLTDSWWRTPFWSANEGVLLFINAHATWKPRADLTFAAEFVYGQTEVNEHSDHWLGLSLLGNFDIDDHLRMFGMWSYIDDTDWVVWWEIQRKQEVGVGFGYQLNKHVEFRVEYRHDFSDDIPDVDTITADVSIGY